MIDKDTIAKQREYNRRQSQALDCIIVRREELCHDCGNPAVAVQASSCDPETGYVEAMALCGPCYAARTGEVDLTPLLDALAREAEDR